MAVGPQWEHLVDESAAPCPEPATPTPPIAPKRRRWSRILRWTLISLGVLVVCVGLLVKDHVRTLYSLRKIPGTKAYVMDYYVDYNIGEVRTKGIDVQHVENSVIATLLPNWTHALAMRLKSKFMPQRIEAIDSDHHCSTLMVHPQQGDVFFGRNFDFLHDACLILKVHQGGDVTSVAVLDLRFLNLNRGDLETTSLFRRIPLLFAPYYLQDGMNQFGVAVADMSVHGVQPPHDPSKPNIIHSLAMRLILDYARTTDEAIELLKEYNVYFVAVKCHLLIADASGKSVVVEFIDGEMKTTPTQENWQVCTNHEICGKSEAENDAACKRYRQASDALAAMGSTVSTSDVMNVMESVKQPSTMWTSVYNLSTGNFSFAYRRQYDNSFADHLERIEP
jgi:predicted choloylglycine hydrolase